MSEPLGRVLVIAGSDSGGGAGIQADIKTITALGGYAATAITAITVQNTLGVHDIRILPADLVVAQARDVLSDIGADAIKIGMLASFAITGAVAALLAEFPYIPVVIDPVMIAKGGRPLLSRRSINLLRQSFPSRATLLTPNVPEACELTGRRIRSVPDMIQAGRILLRMGAESVLMKGGHLPGDTVTDVLMIGETALPLESPRVTSRHTHGTGCTLASACAAGLARGLSIEDAVRRAHAYTAEAIRRAPGLGAGHGPIDHGWPLRGR